ncbi:L-cystine-binding protein FliY [Thauera sp. GDN1]|uniref:substrate-binding periplasmic protein n=1 Tax=Thauera sp. GDN1 TaxID=2944810 RepID=UPI002478CB72|nr:transporter substrate-binding domain-containing protein [Thauera sp. GDN1]WEN40900.1 L-cystine-binding protein FliY [Thauera sp. GDN1]
MKRLLALLLLAVCAPQAQARDLIACGHPAYPPVSWVADGELRGLAPTLVRELFGELGLRVRLEAFGNWKRCLQEVRAGRADIVVAAYRNREREQQFAFSAHYLVADPIALFVRRDRRFAFEDWEDLRGRSVGLLLGDSFGERFDRFAEAALKVERVSTGRQNVRKLVLGRIDFMPIGRDSGRLQSRRLGYDDLVEALPQALVTEYYHVAVRKGSDLEVLLPEIDLRLSALHADGSIARWLQEHAERYLAEPLDAEAIDERLD